jgi:hypothetical protein
MAKKLGYLNMTEKSMRKWIWYFCPKIQALTAEKVRNNFVTIKDFEKEAF